MKFIKVPSNLNPLKEKIAAIQSGNYDVEVENSKIIKCWERLNCNKKECPAYGKLRCWSIAGTCCHGQVTGEFAQKIGDCKKCVVYQESCADEVAELIENFNLMVKEIKFDITEQEKSLQEKAQSARLAELGDMAAVVAHETRNPLHSIGMTVSYLKRVFQGQLGVEFLSIIEEEVEKLNSLISLFIQFSIPAPINIERQNVNTIIRQTVESFVAQSMEKNIELTMDLANDLPEVPCDKLRVEESIINLLKNSFEAIAEKGCIKVSTRRYPEHVSISVKDDGVGIAADKQQGVFTPFYTTKVHGPGLGLSLLDRTAKEHNGSVEFSSQEGKGSIFSLFLPF